MGSSGGLEILVWDIYNLMAPLQYRHLTVSYATKAFSSFESKAGVVLKGIVYLKIPFSCVAYAKKGRLLRLMSQRRLLLLSENDAHSPKEHMS